MKSTKIILSGLSLILTFGLFLPACQKLDRPALGELILDPPPPPLTILDSKSYWHFNEDTRDTGELRLSTSATSISFVPGVTEGSAAQVGAGGYMVVRNVPDALKSPGSFSIAFWMNGVGPVQGGAQGLFAISKSTEFWGNFEVFLENLDNGSEALIKIHMYNAGVASGNGEEWTEVKIPGALNKWTHLAMTYSAATSELTVYADGQPTTVNKKVLGGGNYGPLVWENVTGLVLGSFAFQVSPTLANHGAEGWAKSFNGALDQFRIFTKALTPAEVANLHTNKL
ncbi:MAG: LamG domain-containing protein [Chitinophagaceae bacterium]|jgi:hypothetical protein|nr:LamG domain-containing protein [Chitinophagaceae bacterium]